jgi:metal-responsive CopG/Arc/MetJ family transcriptional regulator
MITFTGSLPEELLKKLNQVSQKLAVPKNKIIEKALQIYLEQINKAEYKKSFKQMNEDANILLIAEEGMAEYLK